MMTSTSEVPQNYIVTFSRLCTCCVWHAVMARVLTRQKPMAHLDMDVVLAVERLVSENAFRKG